MRDLEIFVYVYAIVMIVGMVFALVVATKTMKEGK